ncbi:hypothetical protein OV079_25535 [Nannocystis pusilla]|uniref:Uncharacterized protein n=1 Tax=Nannocystis pusilla TaxID=889268 RepID=A0A9X3ERI0_9BACT|nr:hypothetical protein [Nannocystis pusilla]MCY1008858.1 hypothetical protein [Nannocystis pusilla]
MDAHTGVHLDRGALAPSRARSIGGLAPAEQRERGVVGRSRPSRRSPTAHRRLRASLSIGDVHGAGSIHSLRCAGATSTRLVFVPSRSTARPAAGLAVASSDVVDREGEPANTTNIESTTTRTTSAAAKESYRAATARSTGFRA